MRLEDVEGAGGGVVVDAEDAGELVDLGAGEAALVAGAASFGGAECPGLTSINTEPPAVTKPPNWKTISKYLNLGIAPQNHRLPRDSQMEQVNRLLEATFENSADPCVLSYQSSQSITGNGVGDATHDRTPPEELTSALSG